MATDHSQMHVSMSQPTSRPSTSHQHPHTVYSVGQRRPAAVFDEPASSHYTYVPVASNDNNSWYYPRVVSQEDEDDLPMSPLRGNWGRKTVRESRWHRRGKLAPWGAGLDEWEAEEHARKRLKMLMPPERRSPSPPTLPHLRSPSPPLTAPYPAPITQHLSYSSFIMSRAVTHSFRSPLIEDLERVTNGLIEGEGHMKRALGRLWQVMSEDPDKATTATANARADQLVASGIVPKREDEEDEGDGMGDSAVDDKEKRIARAPDLTPVTHKLFIMNEFPNGGGPMQEPSHFVHPEMQMEALVKALATLRELQDDGREYVERLEEVRELLGDVRAQRDTVWKDVRTKALSELQHMAEAESTSYS